MIKGKTKEIVETHNNTYKKRINQKRGFYEKVEQMVEKLNKQSTKNNTLL